MKKTPMQFRQGDVLIERVETSTTTGKDAREKGRIILAHGEATGHAHEVITEAPAEFLEIDSQDGARILRLIAPGRVMHQEHSPIELDPGEYRVTRQREYTPQAIRNVAD